MQRMSPIPFISTGLAALLAGCASTSQVDSNVNAFSSVNAVPAGATYRFERLPSQQSLGERQAQLEKVAKTALVKVGMNFREDSTQYSVQIGARTQREAWAPMSDTIPGWSIAHRDYVVTNNGQIIVTTPPPRIELPNYRREVTLIVRDLAQNKVVYETHAEHDGRWADSDAVLPAMFEAALKGFPNAAAGMVNVEIKR